MNDELLGAAEQKAHHAVEYFNRVVSESSLNPANKAILSGARLREDINLCKFILSELIQNRRKKLRPFKDLDYLYSLLPGQQATNITIISI